MPIKISIVDDVSSFLRGAGKAEDKLDDVADSLDELARDAQRQGRAAGDDIARGIDRGTDKAEDSVEKLERSFRDMARDASRYSKDAGDDVGRNVSRGTGRAADAAGEFKDEARQNFSEVVSSFDGSMESVADLAQGTFGGLAGSLAGPMGLVAGLGAAAFGAWYANAQAEAEKIEDRTRDMYDDLLESGEQFLSKSFVQQQLADIFGKTEDAVIAWEDLQRAAEETGLTQETVARAFAGDAAAGERFTDALAAAQERLTEKHAQRANAVDIFAADEESDLEGIVKLWSQQQSAIDDASSRASAYGEAARAAGIKSVESVSEAERMYVQLAQTINNTPAEKRVTVKVDVDSSAWDFWTPRVKTARVTPWVPTSAVGGYGKAYG